MYEQHCHAVGSLIRHPIIKDKYLLELRGAPDQDSLAPTEADPANAVNDAGGDNKVHYVVREYSLRYGRSKFAKMIFCLTHQTLKSISVISRVRSRQCNRTCQRKLLWTLYMG